MLSAFASSFLFSTQSVGDLQIHCSWSIFFSHTENSFPLLDSSSFSMLTAFNIPFLFSTANHYYIPDHPLATSVFIPQCHLKLNIGQTADYLGWKKSHTHILCWKLCSTNLITCSVLVQFLTFLFPPNWFCCQILSFLYLAVLLKLIFSFLCFNFKNAYLTFNISHLDYCNAFCSGLSKTMLPILLLLLTATSNCCLQWWFLVYLIPFKPLSTLPESLTMNL